MPAGNLGGNGRDAAGWVDGGPRRAHDGIVLGSIEQAIARRAPHVGVGVPASRVLRNFVVAVRGARTQPITNIDRLPDGTTTLVFRLLDANRADLTVFGPQTRAVYKRAPSCLLAVGVVFRPGGAYPFFGVPMGKFQGCMSAPGQGFERATWMVAVRGAWRGGCAPPYSKKISRSALTSFC